MPRFEKTPIHPVAAVLVFLGLYAIAGLGYALWQHSDRSALVWIVVAVGAFIASAGYQRHVRRKRKRAP